MLIFLDYLPSANNVFLPLVRRIAADTLSNLAFYIAKKQIRIIQQTHFPF
jgi:hypothetical protein